jgi:type I restriction enzyme, R subunit
MVEQCVTLRDNTPYAIIMNPSPIDLREVISSQIPALALLQNIGYAYITPAEALAHRQGKRSKVVLEDILTTQISKLNQIEHRGKIYPFSDANIQTAVAAISQFPYDALYTTSSQIYDLLGLGKSLEQTIDGDKKSYPLKYIDWENPANNVYHVTDEFEIERLNSTQTRRPDIVVFVNGIPLVAIECKRPDLPKATEEAISQHLRNQRTDEIPHFFCVTQILIAIAQNTAQYATTKTEKEFWAVWKEEVGLDNFEAELYALINVALSATQSQKLLSWRESWVQAKIRELWAAGARLVSAQDRLLYSLLKPERLLDLIYGYILFDAGDKKIARYQQYFAVKATIDRVKQQVRSDDSRQGGVIWHTTGSGKSLTMVMLAKALVREPSILNPKIILVNDRVDLDDQLKDTFKDCGTAPIKAKNGKHLLELLNEPKAEIITTVIDKFETVAREKGTNTSADIFVLVDESHRSQYGQVHAKMRNVFPHACYIGFTGTPLLKKDKSTAQKFGGFIHSYTMPKAVGDKAVVPIVYEGRESEFKNTEAVDKWFDRITADLNPEQKADLKRKFKSAEPLYEADARMAEVAYDISQHFDKHFRGTKLKGQFATSSKRAAITYQKLLDVWKIRSAVIISPPDTREDNDSVNEADISEVQRFWKDMMAIYSTPKNYQDRIIEKFKSGDGEDSPDLLIVVDKLLTGFDAPRNAFCTSTNA